MSVILHMKFLVLISIFILTQSCGSNSSPKADRYPTYDRPQPPSFPTAPLPPEEPNKTVDTIIDTYSPDFSPLSAEMYRISPDDIPVIDDYLKFQQGIVLNWTTSRYTDHTPKDFLRLWDQDNVKYVDETEGRVKGIEKLGTTRQNMLSRCPSLALPEYNAPVEIHWVINESSKGGGKYKATDIFLTEDQKLKTIYNGGLFPWLNQTIWINGKNALWDYPIQTKAELGEPWGIDKSFVHEWGHHLAYAIDVNLGRSSYQSWQFTESFAEAIRYTCFGSSLDKPEILEIEYQSLRQNLGSDHKDLRNPRRRPISGDQYSLESMETCIAHEMYHDRFHPNGFLNALIEAYKRVEGRKLDPNPYPIQFDFDGGYAQAPWAGGGFQDNERIAKNQPLLVTRAEFLERFLEVYDCGLANEFIEADIEGMRKFEW